MLEVERIRKDFGNVTAVREVSFAVPDGLTFGLIGPNGAGKTTSMRMILGILVADSGTVRWNGTRVDGGMRRRFGYLPEERGLYGRMHVREQIEYFGRLHGLPERDVKRRANEWIERLDLGVYAERPCGELSKGNQQKVQIACASVHAPELLVLDEPFSGLDPVNAEILAGVLRSLKAEGTALVLSSHQMFQLEELCGAYCIVIGGESRLSGTLADLRKTIPTRTVRVSPASDAVRDVLASIPGAARVDSADDSALEFEVPAGTDIPSVLRRLVAADSITRFEAVEPSLRDVYLAAVGESNA
ncbi:MAG TPA: ATP-binding cassette domain-containing protein [Candidatus Acidoferrales bacterium]|jgi:ABC-2 type transport system ATP-binding protein|nr:ATP-binding cassette domain-containing protein [Candidatus Acidoferrales bacterium]